jgi:hypothetical protein
MRLRVWPLLLLLLAASSVAPHASAASAPDPAPGLPRYVVAQLDLAEPTLTRIDLTGSFSIQKYTLDGRLYTAGDMHDTFVGSRDRGDGTGDEFVGAIESAAYSSLSDTLNRTFPDATKSITKVHVEKATLVAPRTDEYDPPVRITIAAVIERSRASLGIADLSDEAIGAAFQAGARVRTSFGLSAEPGHLSTFTLHAPRSPAGLAFANATNGATLGPRGETAIVTIDATKAAASSAGVERSYSLDLYDPAVAATQPTAEDAKLDVLVDLQDLDVSLGGLTHGDMGTLRVAVSVKGDLRVIKVPDDAIAKFGENVRLPLVTSDGLRILRAHGVVTDKEFEDVEAKLVDRVRAGLESSMGGAVLVTGGFDAGTLDAKLAHSPPTSATPIIFRASANFARPLSGGGEPDKGAIALYTLHQAFSFPRVQGLATTYTVVLPSGLAVTSVETSGATATTGTASDGRDSFSVTPQRDDATATAAIAVTPTFVLAKFWPVVLLALLVVLLLVGTPIAIVVVRRRRRA